MANSFRLSHLGALVLTLAIGSPAWAVPIALNPFDFFVDGSGVSFPGGGSAKLTEVDGELSQLLENDPYLGDPGLFVPSPGATLSFNFDFDDGGGNDEFGAFVLGAAGAIPALSFITGATSAGLVTFDLSSLTDAVVGISFQLNSLELLAGDPQVLGSMVTISNVQFEIASIPVPEPPAFALALAGLVFAFRSRARGRLTGTG